MKFDGNVIMLNNFIATDGDALLDDSSGVALAHPTHGAHQ
jgi:hypothetical protein